MAKRGNNEGSLVKRKDGRWQASIMIGKDIKGKPKRIYYYSDERKEAQQWLAKVIYERQNGSFIEPNRMTFGEWLDIWLKDYIKIHVRVSTWSNYEMMIRLHIKPYLGNFLLRELRPEQLQKLYNHLLTKGRVSGKGGLSKKSVHSIHVLISECLTQAFKNELVVKNIAKITCPPKVERTEMHILNAKQVIEFLNYVSTDRMFAAFLLEFTTGVRRGELLGIRWSSVNFDIGTVKISQNLIRIHDENKKSQLVFHTPKTHAGIRTIALPAITLEALRVHKIKQAKEKLALGPAYQDNDLAFASPEGTPLDPRSFARKFQTLLNKSGVPRIRFHDARHTVATLLLEQNEHPKVVQEILGHQSISTTMDTYSHVSIELKKKAANQLGSLYEGIR